ncbi:hypothetical protein NIES2100_69370 [Calothrix sp. NIES-2100]|nr:hypothetical protein NIES2100_69370 [Calothrix sp. NIES-2100]
MSLAGQEGKNCSSVSNQLSMQPSHLPFAWLFIIEDYIFLPQDTPMRQVLAMRTQSSLLSLRTPLVVLFLKAFCLEKLLRAIFTQLDAKSVHQKANLCHLPEIQLKFGNHCNKNTCVAYVSSTKSFVQ